MTEATPQPPPTPIPGPELRRALVNVLLATRALDPERLAATLGCEVTDIVNEIGGLAEVLDKLGLGVEKTDRGWRLGRTPEMEDLVEKYRGGALLREETLLTLALVARRGPSTMPEIAEIRRTENVREAFETLLSHGLLEEAGRRPGRGRPFIYRATEAGARLLAGRQGRAAIAPASDAAVSADAPSDQAPPAPPAPAESAAAGPAELHPPEESEPIVFPRHPPQRADPPATMTKGARPAHQARTLPTVPAAALPEKAPSTNARYLELEVGVPRCRPRIWRRFLLPVDATFHDLHDAIQLASGSWESFHLWEFRVGESSIGPGENQNADKLASKVKVLDELADEERCVYRYDFGDGWTIDVSLNAIVEKPGGFKRRLIGGAGAWPPEDCGGPYAWRGRGAKIKEAAIRDVFDQ